MPESTKFEYTIYIATTPEKLWDALTKPHLVKEWWRGHYPESDWNVSSSITLYFFNGKVDSIGRIAEYEPLKKLVIDDLQAQWTQEYSNLPINKLSFLIKSYNSLVCLTLIQESTPKMIDLVRGGWPAVLSSLKSLLETNKSLSLDEVFGPERIPG